MSNKNWDVANRVAEGTGVGAAIVGGIGIIVLSLIIIPLLVFWVGYFLGWLSTFVCGEALIRGINSFGFNVTMDNIPAIAGALCWVGWLFHQRTGIKKEEK